MVIGCAAGLSSLMGERIPLNNGFGFEGFTFFKPIMPQLPQHLADRQVDAYNIQHILPYLIGHYTLRGLGLPLRGRYILGFFAGYNLLVLALAVWLWLRLAEDHALSRRGQWIGFFGIFGNFACLKLFFYYPLNIDASALLLGLGMLYFHRRGASAVLLLVSIAGLLVWHTTLVLGSLLLLLPSGLRWPEGRGVLGRPLTLIVAVSLPVLFGMAYAMGVVQSMSGGAEIVRPLVPLSLTLVGIYLFFGLWWLLGPLDCSWAAVHEVLSPARLLATSCLWAAYFVLTGVLAAPGPRRITIADYVMKIMSYTATARPAQFLVAHPVYYGPVLLIIMLLWARVAVRSRELGAGMVAASSLAVVLSVGAESRQLVNLLPFVVLPGVLAIEGLGPGRGFLTAVAVAALVLSRCWLPLNYAVAAMGEAGRSFPFGAGSLMEFPAQVYFMNFGPWTSNEMLIVQGGIVVALGAWLRARYFMRA